MDPHGDNIRQALDAVGGLYTRSLREHGPGPKGVGWKDTASHRLRFEKLAQVIAPEAAAEEISVNDVGCGYGAMFEYLAGLARVKLCRYYGYEISDPMLACAGRRVTDARAEFIKSPWPTHKADYSFLCGTFNVKLDTPEAEWNAYMKDMIRRLAEVSTKGFAFNALSSYVDWKDAKLYYADPAEFFDFCKRHVCPRVSLLHDYPLYEWTLLIRMDSP